MMSGRLLLRRARLAALAAALATLAAVQLPAASAAAPPDAAQREVDEIFSLLAMAVVYKDWQDVGPQGSRLRGHNIGAVLVDPAGQPVFWARNARFVTDNGTEHGELRLIRHFLDCPGALDYLGVPPPGRYPGARAGQGFTLYTTLDPCVMCAGTMLMVQLSRAVFVQSDPDYGHVVERLAAGTGGAGQLPPYPVTLDIRQADLPEAQVLDQAYQRYGRPNAIIPFLRSEFARRVFKNATRRLRDFRSEQGNQAVVEAALAYLDKVVDDAYQADPRQECPHRSEP
jgi:tRNA(Arg) A34 adenosine deaminase TadA